MNAISLQARIVLSLLVVGTGALGYGAGVWRSSAVATASVAMTAPVEQPACPVPLAEKPMPFQTHQTVRGTGKQW